MLKRARQIAFVLAGLYVAIVAVLSLFQRSLFYEPRKAEATIAETGLQNTSEVPLVTADGLHNIAWYSPAPLGGPTIVFLHGNGGVISIHCTIILGSEAA